MKALLVLNMPTICSNCILEQNGVINHRSYSYCGACGITTKQGKLLKDCPLKLMPKKKDINYAEKTSDGYYTLFSKQYVNGFNACIDEILGETE